jgi:hypothetical protein
VNNQNQQVGDYRSRPRWSAGKKMEAVLRLLRGESLEELSRELRVEAHRLAAHSEMFLIEVLSPHYYWIFVATYRHAYRGVAEGGTGWTRA